MNTNEAKRNADIAVDLFLCPTCWMSSGHQCVTISGTKVTKTHAARIAQL